MRCAIDEMTNDDRYSLAVSFANTELGDMFRLKAEMAENEIIQTIVETHNDSDSASEDKVEQSGSLAALLKKFDITQGGN